MAKLVDKIRHQTDLHNHQKLVDEQMISQWHALLYLTQTIALQDCQDSAADAPAGLYQHTGILGRG